VQWKKIDSEQESRLNQRADSHAKEKSYVEPWKIKIVMSSLPFLTDSQTIKHALEKCNGSVNDTVSMLIEADEAGSISSTQESSSVERDYDSDDDQIWGPNKRANRSRLKRAARNLMKDSQTRRAEMAARLVKNDGSQESVSQAVADLEIPDSKDNSPAPFDDEDEWVPSGSEMASDAAVAGKGPTRLKINVSNSKIGKTTVRHQGPRPHAHATARDRKELKKRQQKEDRKKRAQQATSGAIPGQDNISILTKGDSKSSSAPNLVEGTMRTLYI
jgi:OTU domain-containing protein 3